MNFVASLWSYASYKFFSSLDSIIMNAVAKVSRDVMTAKWKYSEPNFEPIGGNDFGSGYPSDPKCKEWMGKNLGHPIFGYPDFARFSWAPMKKTMDEEGITMRWEADDDEEDDPQQMSLNVFVVPKKSNDGSKQPKRKRARLGYHEKLGLTAVTELVVS
jgi:ribonuclease H2 subunit A